MKKGRWIGVAAVALVCAASPAQRYRAVEQDGVWWLESAAGKPLFSYGVCVVDTGPKWDEYSLENPAYSGFRFYRTKAEWAADATRLLKSGGFNTVGAWSEYRSLLDVPGSELRFTPINHMGSSAGFPWLDMWDPALVKVADDIARDQVQLLRKDPRVIGYFSDNELGWWKGALFSWVWKQKTHYTRTRVVDLLERRYRTWKAFTRQFDVEGATGFAELRNKGAVYLRPDCEGIGAVTETLQLLAHRYYSLCKSLIKKWDPDALYLGDRYISNYYPEVAKEAGRYCDVVSTNLNANWVDGGYVRHHFDGLRAVAPRPFMVTEYYMCATENRSGNENNHSGFPVVQTLSERAKGFLNTTERLLHEPDLLGAHWFQYYDEPQKGRGDGENYNFGLVDVNNQPYEELLSTAKSVDLDREHAAAKAPAAPGDTLPPTPSLPFDMTKWQREAAFVKGDDSIPVADLYASWSSDALTLSLFWFEERFTEAYFRGEKVPDAALSTVRVETAGAKEPWLLRLDEKGGKVLTGPLWTFRSTPSTSSELFIKIPASDLGKTALAPGERVQLEVTLVSRTRAYRSHWIINRRLTRDSQP